MSIGILIETMGNMPVYSENQMNHMSMPNT